MSPYGVTRSQWVLMVARSLCALVRWIVFLGYVCERICVYIMLFYWASHFQQCRPSHVYMITFLEHFYKYLPVFRCPTSLPPKRPPISHEMTSLWKCLAIPRYFVSHFEWCRLSTQHVFERNHVYLNFLVNTVPVEDFTSASASTVMTA